MHEMLRATKTDLLFVLSIIQLNSKFIFYEGIFISHLYFW